MNERNDGRDEKGLWLPGTAPNPEGVNGHNKGWQRSGTRLEYWYARPARELRAYADDNEKLMDLSGIDVACLRIVIGSMFGKKALEYFNAGMDRVEGRSRQTILHQGDKNSPAIFTLNFGITQNDSPNIPAPETVPETK